MKLKLLKRGGTAELIMEGELDTVTSPEVDKIVIKQINQFDQLTLNLQKVEYVSSSGLRMFKHAHMESVKQHKRLIIKNVHPMIMEVFEMTGFTGLLTIE